MGGDQSSGNRTASRAGGIWDRIRSFFDGNDRFFRRWSIIRQLGMLEYIWSEGVITFGLLLSVAQIGADVNGGRPLDMRSLLYALAVNALIGAVFGWFTWHRNERRYHRMVIRMEPLRASHNNVDERSAYSRHRQSAEAPQR
jgi:hypothetical protein